MFYRLNGAQMLWRWEMSVPSPGLDPPSPCLQVRTVIIVMASTVYISSVGLCGYVNKFVDRSDEEGGFWYADQWQHPRVVTLAAEVAGRGWNCFSFCEVEAGTRRRQPLVEFFSPLWIHLSFDAGSMTGDPASLSTGAVLYMHGNAKYLLLFLRTVVTYRYMFLQLIWWPDDNSHIPIGWCFNSKISPV